MKTFKKSQSFCTASEYLYSLDSLYNWVGYFFMEEIYKDIPNYEGLYQVSNFGNVKSLKGGKERLLTPHYNERGYFQVGLTKKWKQKSYPIHKLVAMAFLSHVPNGNKIVVDHINNIPTDNRLENLQLISHRHNCSKDRVSSSKYVGVSWNKPTRKWTASIHYKYKVIYLGRFINEQDAAEAYQNALSELNNGKDLNLIYQRNKN
jgi:hypothetical protein